MKLRKRFNLNGVDRTNLGNVLLKMGIITRDQLAEALDVQKSQELMLGACLVFTGALTREELDDALQLQEKMRSARGVDALIDLVEKRSEKTNEQIALVLAGEKS